MNQFFLEDTVNEWIEQNILPIRKLQSINSVVKQKLHAIDKKYKWTKNVISNKLQFSNTYIFATSWCKPFTFQTYY